MRGTVLLLLGPVGQDSISAEERILVVGGQGQENPNLITEL